MTTSKHRNGVLSSGKNPDLGYSQNGVFSQEFGMDETTGVLLATRKAANMTRVKLAELANTSPQQIEKLEKGFREMTRAWAERLAPHLGVKAEFLVFSGTRKIPIVGYAAAGADSVTFADGQGPFDEVEAPSWANETTVAVRVRGTSLGLYFDGWLAFYDNRRDPPDDSLVGALCVCGLSRGRVVIKKLRAGSAKGLFHLESETEPTLFDERVEWAAEVKEMRPR
jgi:transcriptional regulator with XRE-family HTH domain